MFLRNISPGGQWEARTFKKKNDLNKTFNDFNELLSKQKLDGNTVDRKSLFEMLRKSSVIQNNIAIIELEINDVDTEINITKMEREKLLLQRKQLWIKEKKYDFMYKKVAQERSYKTLLQEEIEQEEVIYGNKS